MYIFFKARGRNSDSWNVVQVRSTKLVFRSLWEIWHKSSLENPIGVRLVALERGHRGRLHVTISELNDLKVQSYSRFMIELLKSRKNKMRKFDGKDSVTWILQMEKYFDLHGVALL